jgi:hypothetical protein
MSALISKSSVLFSSIKIGLSKVKEKYFQDLTAEAILDQLKYIATLANSESSSIDQVSSRVIAFKEISSTFAVFSTSILAITTFSSHTLTDETVDQAVISNSQAA